MGLEDRPEHQQHPGPTPEDEQEVSLATTLRQLVDDVFTDRDITERLQAIPGGEALEVLVENWKQGLTQHLVDSAQYGLENIVDTLELIQASADTPVAVTEPYEWQQVEAWHKPFPVAHICREDLRGILPDEQVATLSDDQMTHIATRMSAAYQTNGEYWKSLMTTTNLVVDMSQASPNAPSPVEISQGQDQ